MAKPDYEMADLATLRPTQLTLGLYQVRHKMDVSSRPRSTGGLRRFLRGHRIRTIRGPGGALYIADHHHWARAWLELGWRRAPVSVDADLSDLGPNAFWKRMSELGHVNAYDEHGNRQGHEALPPTVLGMRDDPYRSLAAFARDAGAYRKPGNAYGDFSWARFLHRHLREDMHSIAGFGRALSLAIELARSRKARKLPGYIGSCGTREG
ncbi:ParB-like protein [Cupriavidus pampae]|uniref:Chromosome partitioning protein ParB n=1 Tax=Cupriavidus pampae TaxID=659251 RepID=A0ABM8WV08_9BURK|nr:ParB-like protein [Cupriavidus pampae]CAG9171353.1 hypothetical protein LMG32289_02321 [Cupriavidus pampae]